MDNSTAKKIATLLNERNKLPTQLREHDIINGNYFFIDAKEENQPRQLIACARAKLMSFYAYEIKHVAVNPDFERKGFGQMMINLVEDYIRTRKVPVVFATTRADNEPIIKLFTKLDYTRTKEFTNSGTKHPLILWQKYLI